MRTIVGQWSGPAPEYDDAALGELSRLIDLYHEMGR